MKIAILSLNARICGELLACAVALPVIAADDANAPTPVDRMTSHLMAMLPLDRMFTEGMAPYRDELQKKLNAEQFACLQRELGKDAFAVRRRAEVQRFADAKPEAFTAGLKVLDEGAATVAARIVESTMSGVYFGINQADPDAVVALMELAYARKHADLRVLSGFGDVNEPEESPRAIEAMMNAIMADVGKTCELPVETFDSMR